MSTELVLDLATDEEGFLMDPEQWNADIAKQIAESIFIDMNSEHWLIIDYIRHYFEEHQIVPETRTLLKFMKQAMGSEKGTRRYIHTLFPYGYGQQACKIAGMRKPRKLMLDV